MFLYIIFRPAAVCVCVRACVRACVCVCVRARVCARTSTCIFVLFKVGIYKCFFVIV